jgi:hypothetical protein
VFRGCLEGVFTGCKGGPLACLEMQRKGDMATLCGGWGWFMLAMSAPKGSMDVLRSFPGYLKWRWPILE